MKLILHLSLENLELARAEAETLVGKQGKLVENLLFIDSDEKTLLLLKKRLSFTHKIYQYLFETTEKNLTNSINEFDWKLHYKKDFKLELHDFNCKTSYTGKELADLIWNRLKSQSIKPKANFKNPHTMIEFLFTPKKIYAAILLSEINKDFLMRKPHMKPEIHPTSLNPKIARAMVNLTGIRNGTGKGTAANAAKTAKKPNALTLYDPFCGSGGILIEAAFMDLNTAGYDISLFMLEKAKKNFESYNISKKRYSLLQNDATLIKHRMDYIACDLPYGLNSKKSASLDVLYFDFLKNIKRLKTKRAVIGFPDFINYKKIIKKTGLKIDYEFTIYLHKSLSKKIVVLH